MTAPNAHPTGPTGVSGTVQMVGVRLMEADAKNRRRETGMVNPGLGAGAGELARSERHLSTGPGVQLLTKRCPGCGQVKARSCFWRNARRSDGCATYCKDCGHPGSNHPPALLPTAPILPRLRVAVAGAAYIGDPDHGVRRFARQMAASFGGDCEVYRVQVDRILRGDLTQITFVSADRLAMALGGSAPGFWRADW